MKEIIKKFIEDNNLDFTGSDSDLNGACVVLAGFCCYKGLDDDEAEKIFDDLYDDYYTQCEFSRVMAYAHYNSYGDWWSTDLERAHSMYKFD